MNPSPSLRINHPNSTKTSLISQSKTPIVTSTQAHKHVPAFPNTTSSPAAAARSRTVH